MFCFDDALLIFSRAPVGATEECLEENFKTKQSLEATILTIKILRKDDLTV